MSCKLTIFLMGRRILSMVMVFFFKVQNRPDIMQDFLADDQVVQRFRSSCFIFYYVRDQIN